MTHNDLRSFAVLLISESDNLTIENKLETIKKLKQCNEQQLKTLLSTGEFVSEDFSLKYKDSIDRNFLSTPVSKILDESEQVLINEYIDVTILATAIYRRYFSRAARVCKPYEGNKRRACVMQFKIDAIDQVIKEINKSMSAQCKNSSNPDKCIAKGRKYISKLEIKKGKHIVKKKKYEDR